MFYLTTAASQQIDFDPINFERRDDLIQSQHRMKSGAAFRYVWGKQQKAKFGAMVNSASACQANSWWAANLPMTLTHSGSFVMSCYIVNKSAPFAEVRMGNNTIWQGTIELEGY